MKTKIKQANWKSKPFFNKKDKEYMNIITTVYWQDDDVFIDTDSKFLFQMICENFFHKYKDAKLKMTLDINIGTMFPEAYRLYVYNLIYKELTGKKIKNDILKVKDREELFYRAKLDAQLGKHQKRVLKIIKILEIDFKKESDRFSRILFNTRKKKDFYLSDKAFWEK
ncbi:MAG: hypothetical protein COB07_00280 [Sulfurovum sp.]|nr:MAG: hypothetical protein COB07_00280 [Sulfurovum sp.]